MDYQMIQQQICQMGLSISADITIKVAHFLQAFVDPVWKENPRLHIPAAAAIICEVTKLPTVDNRSLTGTGIKIENVMRHLGDVRKEDFLEAIQEQISRWPHDNHALSEKVQHTKISLRTFKKYKEIFQYLAVRNHKECIPVCIRHDLLSFFWIVFLLLKNSLETLEDISASTKILVVLLEQIFCRTICHLPHQTVAQYLYESQNFPLVGEISREDKEKYVNEYQNLIYSTLSSRNALNSFTKQNLKENQFLLKRLIDDLGNIYEVDYAKLPEGRYIEEITYLQLSKNLTPQAFRIKKVDEVTRVCKVLNFDEDEDSDNEKSEEDFRFSFQTTEKKKTKMRELDLSFDDKPKAQKLFSGSSFGALPSISSIPSFSSLPKPKPIQSIATMTPLTSGMVRNAWVTDICRKSTLQMESEVNEILVAKQINFQGFKQYCLKRIECQVQTLTPHTLDKNQQKVSIWKFFVFLVKDYQSVKGLDQSNVITFVKSLLCLSGSLYNYSMRSLNADFQKYCKIYELELENGFKAIYLVGKHLEMPNFIRQYLYELEKQIIIKEIWDSDCGYKLLNQGQKQTNSIIFKRLHRHSYERIKQVCESLQIQATLVVKIDNVFRQVIQKKLFLLERNKLDHIIICCLIACLSNNKQRNCEALSAIFKKYAYSPKPVISEMQSSSSEQATLLDYYNNVFFVEIMDDIKKNQLLFETIHKSQLKNLSDGKWSIPPISKLFNGNPFETGRPSMRLGNSGSDYQKKALDTLKKKLSQSPIAQQKDSPYFGIPLKRTMTFGNGQL